MLDGEVPDSVLQRRSRRCDLVDQHPVRGQPADRQPPQRRRFARLIASSGLPYLGPELVLTSQITSALRSAATMSISPSAHRQFRSSIRAGRCSTPRPVARPACPGRPWHSTAPPPTSTLPDRRAAAQGHVGGCGGRAGRLRVDGWAVLSASCGLVARGIPVKSRGVRPGRDGAAAATAGAGTARARCGSVRRGRGTGSGAGGTARPQARGRPAERTGPICPGPRARRGPTPRRSRP